MVDRTSSGAKPMVGRVSSGVESLVRQSHSWGGTSGGWCQFWGRANADGGSSAGKKPTLKAEPMVGRAILGTEPIVGGVSSGGRVNG